MAWVCPECGAEASSDTTLFCGACPYSKSAWTMHLDVTRTLTVERDGDLPGLPSHWPTT